MRPGFVLDHPIEREQHADGLAVPFHQVAVARHAVRQGLGAVMGEPVAPVSLRAVGEAGPQQPDHRIEIALLDDPAAGLGAFGLRRGRGRIGSREDGDFVGFGQG
ncbi:hypothetical protein ACFQWF_22410 [Methylorubrum suomiense]